MHLRNRRKVDESQARLHLITRRWNLQAIRRQLPREMQYQGQEDTEAMTSLILFTSPTCTRCPVVKRFFDNAGTRCREVDVSNSKGLAEMRYRAPGMMELPVLVKIKNGREEVYGPGDLLDKDGNIRPGEWSKNLASLRYDPQTYTWSDA